MNNVKTLDFLFRLGVNLDGPWAVTYTPCGHFRFLGDVPKNVQIEFYHLLREKLQLRAVENKYVKAR